MWKGPWTDAILKWLLNYQANFEINQQCKCNAIRFKRRLRILFSVKTNIAPTQCAHSLPLGFISARSVRIYCLRNQLNHAGCWQITAVDEWEKFTKQQIAPAQLLSLWANLPSARHKRIFFNRVFCAGGYSWKAANYSFLWGMTRDEGYRMRLGTKETPKSVRYIYVWEKRRFYLRIG